MGRYLPAFKAYDVRGVVPDEMNVELAYAIGRAFADETEAGTVCVGHDIRLSGPELSHPLQLGLTDAGADVTDLGMVGTEMVYFATGKYKYDGGIMITASHNPPQYNGMKLVRSESRPISGDSGLDRIEKAAFERTFRRDGNGSKGTRDVYSDFGRHLATFDPESKARDLRVFASPGNGAAGLAVEAFQPHTGITFTRHRFEPDGSFPFGVPNPILPESRASVETEMASGGFDFGVAWDGDYDRCFFFDGEGKFIEGYYIVGLLAQAILAQNPGASIVYDPRLTWNTIEIVRKAGGNPVLCKSGHAFIKERMRAENAVYGGEMSAHHYFRDHWYCDSGMIPLVLVAKLVSETGRSLADLVGAMQSAYPCSGEVNSTVSDVAGTLARIESRYAADGTVDKTDGLSIEYKDWRFNLRGSNTEPVIRLNVESRGDRDLVAEKTEELLALVRE
ncbi:MAG: phosphomannomutase [Fimbriimonadaceae bacterium]|nr:phosphomannomutase [Fimbriimonadaceae bacterium]